MTEVDVTVGDEQLPEPITNARLTELVADPGCPYITVSRGDDEYIQARLLDDGVYELEYREAADHFQVYTPDPVLVRDTMWSWIDGDDRWRKTVAWYRIDPAILELSALRGELTDMLDGIAALRDLSRESYAFGDATLDDAFARIDEIAAMEPGSDEDDEVD
ncbi:hypothetical protein [Nocardia arthritidis]|uniref:Uncharacterized protein n=1 Tax=Nocardia arthritidis TaxID=228602 RepID=A0A6G9YFF0_9NOCA|nr:hypothetical protein [Nocardia arthritidis]QIS11904.1 hypothetical protein F5544_20195 [Nocardia arthritidis]